MAAGAGGAAAPRTTAPLPAVLQFSRTEIVQQHIFVVTLNRPDRLNALHNEVRPVETTGDPVGECSPQCTARLRGSRGHQAHEELAKVWDHYETNPDLWVAILTGAGDKAFSAGFGTHPASAALDPGDSAC